MKLDARWFCIFIWTIIVVGCVTDKAIVGYYRIEQQKLELQKIEQSAKIS